MYVLPSLSLWWYTKIWDFKCTKSSSFAQMEQLLKILWNLFFSKIKILYFRPVNFQIFLCEESILFLAKNFPRKDFFLARNSLLADSYNEYGLWFIAYNNGFVPFIHITITVHLHFMKKILFFYFKLFPQNC